jgi:hypothetical protein
VSICDWEKKQEAASGLPTADTATARASRTCRVRRKQQPEEGQLAKGKTINLDRQQSSRCYLAAPVSSGEEKNADKRRR